jgi:hypothetical protein
MRCTGSLADRARLPVPNNPIKGLGPAISIAGGHIQHL